jgi:CheY-like chemotaxis protein
VRDTQTTKTILIVDDSEDMRTLLGQVLEGEGYILFYAEDGEKAVAQAVEHHPNLILMDMSLPGISGWDAVQQLRARPDFQHTPIIAVTAYVTKADEEHAKAVGCNAHLGKPFDIMQMLDTIESLLDE